MNTKCELRQKQEEGISFTQFTLRNILKEAKMHSRKKKQQKQKKQNDPYTPRSK